MPCDTCEGVVTAICAKGLTSVCTLAEYDDANHKLLGSEEDEDAFIHFLHFFCAEVDVLCSASSAKRRCDGSTPGRCIIEGEYHNVSRAYVLFFGVWEADPAIKRVEIPRAMLEGLYIN